MVACSIVIIDTSAQAMLQTVDLDTCGLVTGPGGEPFSRVAFDLLPPTAWDVQFSRGGKIVAAGNGAETGQIVVRVPVRGSMLAFTALMWAKLPGACPRYRFMVATSNPVTQMLIGVSSNCPAESIPLLGELRWTDGLNNIFSALFDVELRNGLVTGTESGGTLAMPILSWPQLSRLTGGVVATDLDAQPTVNVIPFGTIVALTGVTDPATGQLVDAGGESDWQFQDRPDATAPGLVRALDNGGTWVKV